jgi:hypothetical protein
VDAFGLSLKLRQGRDPISNYIWSQFAPGTQQLINRYTSPQPHSQTLLQTLVHEFNGLLQRPSLYAEERFARVSLREDTEALLQQAPPYDELLHLNRMLLEDAYPNEIAKSQIKEIQNVKSFVFGVARNVMKEGWRWKQRETGSKAKEAQSKVIEAHEENPLLVMYEKWKQEEEAKCLNSCLSNLSAKKYEVFSEYHLVEEDRNEARKRLATRFKLTPNGLRQLIHKIKDELGYCVRVCLKQAELKR